MKTLLIIPPFIQSNTYFPSVTQLSGFLRSKGYQARSFDLSISVLLEIFSRDGLKVIFSEISRHNSSDPAVKRALALKDRYISTIGQVISFLQGKNPSFAYRLSADGYLPQGEFFEHTGDESSAFGYLGIQDKAKYYCSLYIDDLSALIAKTISPHFGLSRYAEKPATGCESFEMLEKEVMGNSSFIEAAIARLTEQAVLSYRPDVVGYSIPFPGTLPGAMLSASVIKGKWPEIKIVFGGGYVNTELRNMRDTGIFRYTDYITYDDGELPLLNLLKNIENSGKDEAGTAGKWVRTLRIKDGLAEYLDDSEDVQITHSDIGLPDTHGIEPENYFAMAEMLNPMHRLWSDGFWNKITAAHGCYWHRCTFCDTSLDYIGRYSPAAASSVVDRMEGLIGSTGRNSFHFTDEAAPPSLLKEIALEILRRRLQVVWWGNIRFEKAFTPDLCRLLALSGCIAVSGGLEAAEERLLKLINKGVTIPQAVNVLSAFNESGIMVHAYLMYGFPTQTEGEIIDSLEIVRQFFHSGILRSAYWHRFSLTVHSPIAREPQRFGIKIPGREIPGGIHRPFPVVEGREFASYNAFANNDLHYEDRSGADYGKYSAGLNKALYNFMHGIGLDWKLQQWFGFRIPSPKVNRNTVEECLRVYETDKLREEIKANKTVVWTGGDITIEDISGGLCGVTAQGENTEAYWETDKDTAKWLISLRQKASPVPGAAMTASEMIEAFPGDFEGFRRNDLWKELRDYFLLIV